MSVDVFMAGEPVYHPRYGFGTVTRVAEQDVGYTARGATASSAENYYEIALLTNGTLFVPVGRAEDVGLRRLTNGLEAIANCLVSQPEELPDNGRQRLAELKACERIGTAHALTRGVRDLAARGRIRALSDSEKRWLDEACQRLSTEAALVDHVAESHALAVIKRTVRELTTG